jgi:hypothetical protein
MEKKRMDATRTLANFVLFFCQGPARVITRRYKEGRKRREERSSEVTVKWYDDDILRSAGSQPEEVMSEVD